MCLYVFCEGKERMYEKLKPSARSLGAAFQKVNFFRDIKADYNGLSQDLFSRCDFNNFTRQIKSRLKKILQKDFENAMKESYNCR